MKLLTLPVMLVMLLSFTGEKTVFEKKEIRSVKYAVAVLPGAFPKSYGYFNKAFKFNNVDPLGLTFIATDSVELMMAEKIMEDQLGSYLNSKNIEMPNVTSNKVYHTLRTYGQQVMTLIDKTGKRFMCINAFCNPENFTDKWLMNWVEVKDGGTCFWHLIIGLSDKKLLFAHPNGEA